jgi:hypothetical protein
MRLCALFSDDINLREQPRGKRDNHEKRDDDVCPVPNHSAVRGTPQPRKTSLREAR